MCDWKRDSYIGHQFIIAVRKRSPSANPYMKHSQQVTTIDCFQDSFRGMYIMASNPDIDA
jgi:hypothetical protein